jgi:hypothetical protein
VCSVQFNVAAGVTSSHTTTAFARTFSKTVETEDEEEEDAKHRHLSECSFTVGGRSSGMLARSRGLACSLQIWLLCLSTCTF